MYLILGLSVIALCLVYVQYRTSQSRKKYAYAPNPPEQSWLLGHASKPGHIREFMTIAEHSKAHYLRVFFLSILQISEDKLAKTILNDDIGYAKGVLYRPYRLWFKEGLTPAEGEKGRAVRKQIAPAFSKSRQQVFVPIFNRVATALFNQRWRNTPNLVIDIFEDSRLLTIDAISAACGVSEKNGELISTITNKSQDLLSAFKYIWNEASTQRFMSSQNIFVSLFAKYLTPKGKMFTQKVTILQELAEHAISKRKEAISEGRPKPDELEKDFLDHFLDMNMTEEQTRDMIINFMFAATDTVALSISWTLVLLAKYPRWQEVIYEELKEEEGEKFSSSYFAYDTKNTKAGYLVACLNEAMRLFPPLPFLSRNTLSDVTLEVEDKGENHHFQVAKGQEILLNFWSFHRDETKWDKPTEFDPLRFYTPPGGNESSDTVLQSNKEKGTFCPFSLGRRNCIGQTFAMTEAIVAIGRIVKRYHLSVDESFDPKTHPLAFTTSLQPAQKIFLHLKPRSVQTHA